MLQAWFLDPIYENDEFYWDPLDAEYFEKHAVTAYLNCFWEFFGKEIYEEVIAEN